MKANLATSTVPLLGEHVRNKPDAVGSVGNLIMLHWTLILWKFFTDRPFGDLRPYGTHIGTVSRLGQCAERASARWPVIPYDKAKFFRNTQNRRCPASETRFGTNQAGAHKLEMFLR